MLSKRDNDKKIYKTATVIILVGLFAAIPIAYMFFKDNSAARSQRLATALQATEAQLEKDQLHAWGRLSPADWNREALTALLQSVMQQLGVPVGQYSVTENDNQERLLLLAVCRQGDRNIMVAAENLQLSGAYLVINIEDLSKQPQRTDAMRSKISGIFQNTGSSAHINTCLTGWLDGKLEQDNFAVRIKQAFQAIGAVVLDRLEQPGFMSCTSFSPEIDEFMAVGGKKTNVNMAIRYSPYNDRTYIIIGSPVITEEY